MWRIILYIPGKGKQYSKEIYKDKILAIETAKYTIKTLAEKMKGTYTGIAYTEVVPV